MILEDMWRGKRTRVGLFQLSGCLVVLRMVLSGAKKKIIIRAYILQGLGKSCTNPVSVC